MRWAAGGADQGLPFEGRIPLRRRERPWPSLKSERTSSERGSPGRTQPRFLLSVPLGLVVWDVIFGGGEMVSVVCLGALWVRRKGERGMGGRFCRCLVVVYRYFAAGDRVCLLV